MVLSCFSDYVCKLTIRSCNVLLSKQTSFIHLDDNTETQLELLTTESLADHLKFRCEVKVLLIHTILPLTIL